MTYYSVRIGKSHKKEESILDKKKYIWIIVVIIIAIIYGRMDSKNKIILPLVLLGICIVALICVFIWIIRENICLKKYGPEETVEITVAQDASGAYGISDADMQKIADTMMPQ